MTTKGVIVEVGVLRAKVIGKYPYAQMSDLLAFRPEGWQFSPKYADKTWDGWTRLLEQNHTFPSGLTSIVLEFLKSKKIPVTLRFRYKVPSFKRSDIVHPIGFELRDYQDLGVYAALLASRGVIRMPTGSGKTVLATSIIRTIAKPAIILVHTKELLYQHYNTLLKTMNPDIVGIIGDGKNDQKVVDVGMVQTLARNKRKYAKHLRSKKVLFGDEIHHAVSNSWYWLMMSIPARFRFGLTATPPKSKDFMRLQAVTGKIIYSVSTQRLIKEGYLSKPDILMGVVDKEVIHEDADHLRAYKEGVIHGIHRNNFAAKVCALLLRKKVYPICILFKSIEHGSILKETFEQHGVKAVLLDGSKPSKVRRRWYSALSKGTLKVLLCSTIFDEGLDIPGLRAIIGAGGGKSWKKVIQRLGRGLRVAEGKIDVLFIDFFDQHHKYLRRHSNARKKAYKDEGHEPTVLNENNLLEYINTHY